jgi:hypothetical protein
MADSSVASFKRAGGRVVFGTTSTFSVATSSPGFTATRVSARRQVWPAVVDLGLLAVDRRPARDDRHLALDLNGSPATRVMRVVTKFGSRVERREKRLTTKS